MKRQPSTFESGKPGVETVVVEGALSDIAPAFYDLCRQAVGTSGKEGWCKTTAIKPKEVAVDGETETRLMPVRCRWESSNMCRVATGHLVVKYSGVGTEVADAPSPVPKDAPVIDRAAITESYASQDDGDGQAYHQYPPHMPTAEHMRRNWEDRPPAVGNQPPVAPDAARADDERRAGEYL